MDSSEFFNPEALTLVCEADEQDFGQMYDMVRVAVNQPAPADFYWFKDNGSSILAVAHLDTVGAADQRKCHIVDTEGGTVVYSRALDDRLGAYVLAELLPSMGMTFDLLLTTGEEQGLSTAAFFDPSDHHKRQYNWIIEFDRGGTDVVLYQYDDVDTREMVEDTGARVEAGIFSDISFMEHLGIKAFNWGVGYRDYHYPRAHVWLDDMFMMVDYFVDFHETWSETHLPHEARPSSDWRFQSSGSSWWDDEDGVDTRNPDCDERAYGNCEGEITEHDTYGRLCDEHLSWYSDDVVDDLVKR